MDYIGSGIDCVFGGALIRIFFVDRFVYWRELCFDIFGWRRLGLLCRTVKERVENPSKRNGCEREENQDTKLLRLGQAYDQHALEQVKAVVERILNSIDNSSVALFNTLLQDLCHAQINNP